MNYGRYADYAALIVIVAVLILFENITLNNPIVFGDEGYYAGAARWMAKNLIIPQTFPLFENKIMHESFSVSKPLYFLFETFGYFFGGETLVKIIIPMATAVGASIIYFIAKKYYGWQAGLASTAFFLFTPSMVTYGVLGYTDALLITFALGAIHFGKSAFDNSSKKHLLLAGAFTGLAILTKNSGMFLLLFFLLYEIFIDNMKNKKYFVTIVLIAFLMAVPWLIRNQIVFGSPCYWKLADDNLCGPKFDIKPPRVQELQFEGRTIEAGTETSLFKFGFLNYSNFAYGWALPTFFFLGLALLILRRNNSDKMLLILLASIIPLFYFSTWRAEDTARYMLPLVIPASLIGGSFVLEVFNSLAKKHILIGIVLIIVVFGFSWIYGKEKIYTMLQVKQFVPGAIDACKWVRENTDENSILFATYGSQIRYQCERKLLANNAEEIMLGNESTSYNYLKLNGINYVFVINGLIAPAKLQENYPQQFVDMMEKSTFFKKIFDNTEKFGSNGARIFEVL